MGKKKAFIDKKTATTYSLIFRSQEETADSPGGPDRVLKPHGVDPTTEGSDAGGKGDEAEGRRWPSSHPLAWLHAAETNKVGDDARRREIVGMGLPDDGYDYTKHLRVVGSQPISSLVETSAGKAAFKGDVVVGTGEEEEEAAVPGPSVFIPAVHGERVPVKDEKTMDASRLVLHGKAADDDAAEEVAAGVTAFSKEVKIVRGEGRGELTELQRAMLALEEVEDEEAYDAQMLDDEFVLQATERDLGTDVVDVEEEEEEGEDFSSGIESGEDEEEEDDEEGGIRGYPGYKGDGVSLASSYWRKERKDRNEQLSMIDERFERLAFQYDEDQIGELEEEEGEEGMRGASDIGHFEGILDEFIEKNRSLVPGGSGDPELDEALAARQKAKEYAREYEARPQRGGLPEAPVRHFDDDPEERWDCQSVLSLRSNLENHPGKIVEPGRRRKATGPKIQLSAKTGLPIVRDDAKEEGSSSSGGSETVSVAASSVARRKGESKEEKKSRKAAVKEAQRAARANKKELKMMFKEQEAKIGRMAKTHCTVPL